MNTVKVFGHKSPDTDTIGSAIIFAWFLKEIRALDAVPYRLGELNRETAYVLDRWGIDVPELLGELTEDDRVAVVDTTNPGELPDDLSKAEIIEIVDHHKMGGLVTSTPLTISIRPLGCTATIIYKMAKENGVEMPDSIKKLTLSCILSDTLMFRSPITTNLEREYADELSRELNVDVKELADEMFDHKSDLTGMSALELLNTDSKMFELQGKKVKVSVLETTKPANALALQEDILIAMRELKERDKIDEVLFFAIDILKAEATCIAEGGAAKEWVSKAFGVTFDGEKVLIPDVLSRKKQIIPKLS